MQQAFTIPPPPLQFGDKLLTNWQVLGSGSFGVVYKVTDVKDIPCLGDLQGVQNTELIRKFTSMQQAFTIPPPPLQFGDKLLTNWQVLGSGSFGVVHKVTDVNTNTFTDYAMKDIPCLGDLQGVQNTELIRKFTSMQQAFTIPPPPLQFGDKLLTNWQVLGSGSFGVVHKVTDVNTNTFTDYAMKDIPCLGDLQMVNAQREVETLARISHPNVIAMMGACSSLPDNTGPRHMLILPNTALAEH